MSASSEQRASNAALAVDGRVRTRWVSANAGYPQWLTLDLGRPRSVGYVRVVWYMAARRTYAYDLQASLDRKSWSLLSSGMRARFVRVRVTGTSAVHGWASIREVSVYSWAAPASTPKPTPPPTPTPTPTPTPKPTPAPAPIPRSTGALNLNPPNGYVYNGGGVTSVSGTLSLGSNCTIVGVNFGGGGVRIRGNANTVQGCTFGANSWASLLIYVGNDNVIAGNTFNEATASGSSIQILGGKRNQISGNVTHGGITAIASLYSRSVNGGGAASLIEDNVISGNTCSGFSEEGITFDVLGNQAADIPCLEYDHIRAVSGSSLTLSSLPFPSYVGYDVVFLSGALAGHTRSIVGQSGASFTLDAPATGAAANDQVVIGATFKDNLVSGNTVSAASGNNAILLYGMAFGNRIENNHVLVGNVKVESLDNLVIASGNVTNSYGRGPCGFNTVKGNVVSGDVSLEYYAIPTISGHANTYPAYVSVGNNLIGNTCSRVDANQQVAYIAGNSGASSLSSVTLNPVEMRP